jgi:hypothetical protein
MESGKTRTHAAMQQTSQIQLLQLLTAVHQI